MLAFPDAPDEPNPPDTTETLPRLDAHLTLVLRRAVASDIDWLRTLHASTRADEMAMMPWPSATKAAFLAQQFSLQHHHFVTHYPRARFDVVLCNAERVGRFYVDRGVDPGVDQSANWCIVDIALLPAWRERGIGRYLITQTLQQADAVGAHVDLQVATHNGRARALYERLGFAVTEAGDMHLAMRHLAVRAHGN